MKLRNSLSSTRSKTPSKRGKISSRGDRDANPSLTSLHHDDSLGESNSDDSPRSVTDTPSRNSSRRHDSCQQSQTFSSEEFDLLKSKQQQDRRSKSRSRSRRRLEQGSPSGRRLTPTTDDYAKKRDARLRALDADGPTGNASLRDDLRSASLRDNRQSSSYRRDRQTASLRDHRRSAPLLDDRRSSSRRRSQYDIPTTLRLVETTKSRSKSLGRSQRNRTHGAFEDASALTSPFDENEQARRKSKVDKIRQLQAKNETYKEEFRKVQKDRKALKKEVASKKEEIASLVKEIDNYIAETSHLKLKLSESMQQMENTGRGGNMEQQQVIAELTKELKDTKAELETAIQQVVSLNTELDQMQEYAKSKDQEIASLKEDFKNQMNAVQFIQQERDELRKIQQKGSNDEATVKSLLEENKRLQTELGSTLGRATDMVKEREEAISELLKENDDLKGMVDQKEVNSIESDSSREELRELKEVAQTAQKALEQTQHRNVELREELEKWTAKGNKMKAQIEDLKSEVEAYQEKASAAEETVLLVQASATDTAAEVEKVKLALNEVGAVHRSEMEEARAEFEEYLEDTDARHREELAHVEMSYQDKLDEMEAQLLEAEEAADFAKQTAALAKANPGIVGDDDHNERTAHSRGDRNNSSSDDESEASSDSDPQAKQAKLLQAAVKNRKDKSLQPDNAGKGGWGVFKKEEVLDENQKRIKELEMINADQTEEINKLKSDLVKLRSVYNEEVYVNKKKVDQLQQENKACSLKAAALQEELETLRRAPSSKATGSNPFD